MVKRCYNNGRRGPNVNILSKATGVHTSRHMQQPERTCQTETSLRTP
jgi:hypothetical protein